MKIEKRHIVLAALVVALGAAVYINWQFSGNDVVQSGAQSGDKVIGDAQYVTNPSMLPNPGTSSESGESTPTTESKPVSDSANEYFTKAILERQKARDDSVELLEKIIKDASSDEAAKKEAVGKAAQIAKNIELESKIESLLKAKGFTPCMAFLENGKANIVVASEGLLPHETVTIKDIVKNQGEIPFEDIIIVEVK